MELKPKGEEDDDARWKEEGVVMIRAGKKNRVLVGVGQFRPIDDNLVGFNENQT